MTERSASLNRRELDPAIARHAPAVILFAIGLLLYGYTLPFPFVFDDHIYLLNNPLATDARSFRYPFEFHDFANRAKGLGLDPDLSTNIILRPVAYLTFYLNYLVGGMNPAGFRAVNIAIHCANAVLVFALLSRLLRHAVPAPASVDSVRFASWTSALLFLVHPLQIESVTYIIQRFTSFGTFFYLASVLLFVIARTTTDETKARRCRRWSLASLLVGMLTKEFLFTAVFVMVLLDWLVLRAPLREACRRILPWAVCLPLIPILMALTAVAQSGEASFGTWLNVAGPKDQSSDYPLHYALTQPGVILTYLRLMFLPAGLNIDPDHPLCTSPAHFCFIGPVGLLIALLAGSGAWYLKQPDDPHRSVAFCFVLWIFGTFSIDSSIVPLPDVMSEHRSYLPSVGVFCAVACLADAGRKRLGRWLALRWILPVCLGVWLVGLTAANVDRHTRWRSNVAIWSDAAAKSPNKVRVWANLGTAYSEAGMHARAAECFGKAISLQPASVDARFKLANAEVKLGRFREALAIIDIALRIQPHSYALNYLRAECFMRLAEYHPAIETLKHILSTNPKNLWSHLALAEAYARSGRAAESLQHCQTARSLGLTSDLEHDWVRKIETLAMQQAASR